MSKPTITAEEVASIAKLARLALTDEEIAAATADLANVLDHFAAIQEIDTTGVPTADDASGLVNKTRQDVAAKEALASHDDLLAAAPDTQDGHIKVKAVF